MVLKRSDKLERYVVVITKALSNNYDLNLSKSKVLSAKIKGFKVEQSGMCAINKFILSGGKRDEETLYLLNDLNQVRIHNQNQTMMEKIRMTINLVKE